MSYQDIPAVVRELRQSLNLTQEQFAQRIGVTYSTVNHWENGKRAPQPFLARRLLELRAELDPPHEISGGTSPARGPGLRRPNGAKATGPDVGTSSVRKAIQHMVNRIVERFRPEKVILFGSHARGEARPDSDVDLLVVMPAQGSKREAQLRVRSALRDIRVPKDVLVSTPDEFAWRQRVAGTIERLASLEGRVLYVRG
jgi:predicted nucleotidyltransferase/DNA-binding XRE family transcriptional regulator